MTESHRETRVQRTESLIHLSIDHFVSINPNKALTSVVKPECSHYATATRAVCIWSELFASHLQWKYCNFMIILIIQRLQKNN